ncbi:MAG TPA: hypothetical protein PLU87_06020 [Sedimentisphaerales bacterium]|nr:hypothetical protein [Sedimentisphaerales bacterium]HRS10356.1 hypothetical protein [Sedimentisphaerales bacterium]HRV47061.1 hypothetical protein [Sedimentisphaerales bacterium]
MKPSPYGPCGLFCGACGAEIVWYQKQCPCGQELDAFEVPE